MLAGRYRLIGILGRGGMGAVWRAHDEQLDRYVAVKELRLPEHLPAAERDNWIARLDREARAAARLKHPGIVTVHDRILDGHGRPWIVMELVHGRSLDDLLKAEGPLPPHQVARIGLQMVDALRAAHRMGITHRDIKPSNILLEGTRVVLTDFGIAAVDGDATLTASGVLMGTPAFMSPEQVRGLPATAESDLWSLGATLYTAAEGRTPFTGESPGAVLIAVATEDPAAPVRAGSLEPVLRSLLRKAPAERPTLEQLHTTLTQLSFDRHAAMEALHHEPPLAASRRGKRARIVLACTAVLALLVAASTAGYVVYDKKSTADESNATFNANLRAARDLGVPVGFTRTSETRTGADLARVTYAISGTCDDGCPAKIDASTKWLSKQFGVAMVAFPDAEPSRCLRGPDGCTISVVAIGGYDGPVIRQARVWTQDNRFLLRIDIG